MLMLQCTSELDLSSVFESVSNDRNNTERHYNSIHMNNTVIIEIKANSFKDFTFDRNTIEYCNNLTRIDQVAFTKINQVTFGLFIQNNSLLRSSDITFWDVLSKVYNYHV